MNREETSTFFLFNFPASLWSGSASTTAADASKTPKIGSMSEQWRQPVGNPATLGPKWFAARATVRRDGRPTRPSIPWPAAAPTKRSSPATWSRTPSCPQLLSSISRTCPTSSAFSAWRSGPWRYATFLRIAEGAAWLAWRRTTASAGRPRPSSRSWRDSSTDSAKSRPTPIAPTSRSCGSPCSTWRKRWEWMSPSRSVDSLPTDRLIRVENIYIEKYRASKRCCLPNIE